MGVRLLRFDKRNALGGPENNIGDHNELINRDLMNQHPIHAITGLQEALNDIDDLINEKEHLANERIELILEDILVIQKAISDISKLNVVNSVEETYSLKLSYDKTAKSLKGDVKIFSDKDDTNSIQVLADGLYVPKTTTEETNTVKWAEESFGETLADIYQNGLRFSHNNNSWSNMYDVSEANAWYWDNTLQSFVQPKNTSYFTGFVTQDCYDYYTHTVRLRSTDGDNDVNGVVIGFVFDENGNPHTLTALCERVGWTGVNNWALVYDFYLPDQQILFKAGNGPGGQEPSGAGSSGWSGLGNGIVVRTTKHKNIITAACSNWNSDTGINENTTITIDLNNYSWGHLFQGAVRYGYCNISQAQSFFQDIEFHSENVATATRLLAFVKVSNQTNNAIVIKDDGLYSPEFTISSEEGNALVKKQDGVFVSDKTKNIKEIEQRILVLQQYISQVKSGVDAPIGHILSFMGTSPPPYYLKCDGAEYSITEYQQLADFFKEQYGKANRFGGDGILTFCVPNLNESVVLFSTDNDVSEYIQCIKFKLVNDTEFLNKLDIEKNDAIS